MNIGLLENVIGSASNGRLLAAGPLTRQPGTKPYRLVLLRDNGNAGFTVHSEFFPESILKENYNLMLLNTKLRWNVAIIFGSMNWFVRLNVLRIGWYVMLNFMNPSIVRKHW